MSELMWMWLNKAALAVEGFTPFGASGYWSATEGDPTISWGVTFSNGVPGGNSKDGAKYRSKCVREL